MDNEILTNKTNKINQLVTFSVADEEYGLEILQVQEVIRLPKICKLPKAPIFIKGVIDLRGNVIPVLDLREKFGLDTKNYTEVTRVIIVEVNEKKIGMIVDTVSQVIRVYGKDIMPPPPMINEENDDYVEGVVRLEDRLIILLKVANLLSTEEIIQLQQVNINNNQVKEPVVV